MRLTILLPSLLLAVGSLSVSAAEPDIGATISTCAACHGAEGISPDPQYPHLAGQHADYLERALLDYQSGKRKNPIMSGQVSNLSEDEIAALAEYYAAQSGPLYVPTAE